MIRNINGVIITISISLNFPQIFPMHAEDDRYAKLFLFTEKELRSSAITIVKFVAHLHPLFIHSLSLAKC